MAINHNNTHLRETYIFRQRPYSTLSINQCDVTGSVLDLCTGDGHAICIKRGDEGRSRKEQMEVEEVRDRRRERKKLKKQDPSL